MAWELFHRALERGVAVTPGALFSPTRKFNNFIRICLWQSVVGRSGGSGCHPRYNRR